jgi:hypothetical protein
MRCVCQPSAVSTEHHWKAGTRVAAHLNPKCPHSTLADTTRPLPKPKPRRNLRLR